MLVTHESIKPFIDNNSSILILGSFPSVKTREEEFCYAHKSNRFYKVVVPFYMSHRKNDKRVKTTRRI